MKRRNLRIGIAAFAAVITFGLAYFFLNYFDWSDRPRPVYPTTSSEVAH